MRSTDLLRKYIDILAESESTDINSIASTLDFKPTHKQPKKYKFIEAGKPGQMPPMTYTQAKETQRVVTVTSDGKETENTANPGDIIMSGPTKENYVLKFEKFQKLYDGELGQTVTPEQSPRMVAVYHGPDTVKFKASWGEDMILKPGDYLVKEPDDRGYYRIARQEYEETYNPPGH